MIKRFDNFLNEGKYQITIFDLVVNENGEVVYDGDIPVKGHLDMINSKIIGSDENFYIAAIDRSGNLFSFLEVDEYDNILYNGEKVKYDENYFWNKSDNYSEILPILPTGWVNVKIDMEVIKKIRRYSSGISKKKGIGGLLDKLEILGKPKILSRVRSTETIQREMSAIMMLHYLNELKSHFDPSSSGFLFESYVGGLIPDCRVKEDNSPIDLVDSLGNEYQIKLLTFSDNTTKITRNGNKYLSHYIVGFKFADKIRVFILDGKNHISRSYVGNFSVRTGANNFSFPKFRDCSPDEDFVFDIPLLNIDDKINKIAVGLKDVLDVLYINLSKFQFNVETILTGVDETGELISENEFDSIKSQTEGNLKMMQKELVKLIGIVKTK
jgi:hypothetical protein